MKGWPSTAVSHFKSELAIDPLVVNQFKLWADSRGERNELGELLQWCHVTKCLAGSTVEAPLDSRQVLG